MFCMKVSNKISVTLETLLVISVSDLIRKVNLHGLNTGIPESRLIV